MRVIVGFSANPEIVVEWDPNSQESKIPASSFRYALAGSSVNVWVGLKTFGVDAFLLATCGCCDPESWLLEGPLRAYGNHHRLLRVRKETSRALLPVTGSNSRLVGKKADLEPSLLPSALEQVHKFVSKHSNSLRVATGSNESELELVECLYGNACGKRVLNPNISLMRDLRHAKQFLRKSVDALVCNDAEMSAMFNLGPQDFSPDMMREIDVPFAVVTCNSNGAYIKPGKKVFHIPAVCVGEAVAQSGAGDWWLAGFLSCLCSEGKLNFQHLDESKALKAAHFAAAASGFKVTMIGSAIGPTLTQVENLLADS